MNLRPLAGGQTSVIDKGAVCRAGVRDEDARLADLKLAVPAGNVRIRDHDGVLGSATEDVAPGPQRGFLAIIQKGRHRLPDGRLGINARCSPPHGREGFIDFSGKAERQFKAAQADPVSRLQFSAAGHDRVINLCAVGASQILQNDSGGVHGDLRMTATDAGVFECDVALSSDRLDAGAELVFAPAGVKEHRELNRWRTENVAVKCFFKDQAAINTERHAGGIECLADRTLNRFDGLGRVQAWRAHHRPIGIEGRRRSHLGAIWIGRGRTGHRLRPIDIHPSIVPEPELFLP